MTPVPRHDYRIGVPRAGRWREIANTDSRFYGGSDLGNDGARRTRSTDARARPSRSRSRSPCRRSHRDAARRGLSMARFPDRLLPGVALSAGRHLGRARHQFRRLLRPRRPHRALPVRSVRPARDRALRRCRNAPTRSGTAICPKRAPGLIYGYRAHGPYEPQHGHRFNPHKLLLDPYARRLAGELRWSDALFGYRVNSPRADLSFDRRDSAPGMLKAVVSDDSFNWGDDRPPNVPWSDTVIYEAHVRGLTMLRTDLRPHERGTFAALADPHVIDHLRRLGVTAVELLPIHAFVQDRHLLEQGLRNYWGYNTHRLLRASSRATCPTAPRDEMRIAVRRLHAAGIEVILDVVYNHTAEGNELGPTLSFRGLDNASYYRLVPDNPRHCINDTGTGNTLNLVAPARAADGDGFAALLGDRRSMSTASASISASTLGREGHGFDPRLGLLRRHPPGSGAVARQADLRALGPRPGRLPARQSSAGLRRMERPLPRRRAPLLARRRGPARRLRRPPRRLGRPVRPPRRAGRGPRSTTSPRTTASRWPTS